MNRSTWLPLVVLAVITAIFGWMTAMNSANVEPTSESIIGTWTLVEGNDSTGELDTSIVPVTLVIDSSMMSAKICNSAGAEYTLTGSHLTTKGIMTTEMWCETPAGIMDLETRLTAILEGTTTAVVEKGQLVLAGPFTRLVFDPAK